MRTTLLNSLAARLAAALIAGLLLCAGSAAQSGYSTKKYAHYGLSLPVARDYDAIPIQPTEEWVILYFAEQEAFREAERKRFRPELRFVWIDHPAPTGPLPAPEERESKVSKEIRTFERYMEVHWPGMQLAEPREAKPRDDNESFEYDLTPSDARSRGWARTFRNPSRTIAIFGYCAEEDYDDQLDIWDTMTRKIDFFEPETEDLEKLERYYARGKYSHPKYRVKIRAQLVDGWKAEDTENFIIAYSTPDEPLIRLIKSELEAIRKQYVELFPPAREIDAVSTVRVCRDEAEYLKYGGAKGSAGYWNSVGRELVFYDNEGDGRAGSGKADSRIVLYHEAFHQYVYYAVGEIAPHYWYNEGNGDYFSGALIKGGKVKKIGVNPWRVGFIQAVIEGQARHGIVPLHELIEYERDRFYDYDQLKRGICYAQSWSLVYFLRTSKVARRHETWSKILDVYFETLKQEYASRSVQSAEGQVAQDAPVGEGSEIAKASRDAALEAAFSGVDLVELEEAWREYTLTLKVPK